MMRRFRTGWPRPSARKRPSFARSAAGSPSRCAMAKTRIRPPDFTGPATSGPASPRRGKSRASSSPTITSTTPTPLSNLSASSTQRALPPLRSSSTPIPAAWPKARVFKEAYLRAQACDPVSAFGGIVALNSKLDAAAAAEIVKIFTEVIIAPDADEEAIALIAAKKNLRLLLTGGLPDPRAQGFTVRSVAGGMLFQSRDNARRRRHAAENRHQTRAQRCVSWPNLKFAFRVAKHVKSNAIVYAKDGATVGIGAGQMSRVNSSRIAAWKSAEAARAAGASESWAKGSVVASDAFFPFADGLLAAAEGGRHGGDPARRVHARRRGDQDGGRGWPGHGDDRIPPFPSLRRKGEFRRTIPCSDRFPDPNTFQPRLERANEFLFP